MSLKCFDILKDKLRAAMMKPCHAKLQPLFTRRNFIQTNAEILFIRHEG